MCRDISKKLKPDTKSYDTLDTFSNIYFPFSFFLTLNRSHCLTSTLWNPASPAYCVYGLRLLWIIFSAVMRQLWLMVAGLISF